MIRVLIAEDEPPTARRLKRLIEGADPAFAVVATAMDGEQALERLAKSPADIVFTDIRMPVLDGLKLMDTIARAYPDILVVVVSGYQDFTYVSHAIRARAADYLLKPVSREAMEQLLARLKVMYARQRHERMTRQLTAQIHRAGPSSQVTMGDEEGVPLGACLFCAGAMPYGEDAEMYPGAAVWAGIPLEQWAMETSGGADAYAFTWAFVGHTPVERFVIYRAEGTGPESWARELYARVREAAKAPVSCACLREPVALTDIGGELRRLRGRLRREIRVGHSLFLAAQPGETVRETPPEDNRELALQIAGLISGDSAEAGKAALERVAAEGWTQVRLHRLLMEAVSILEPGRINPAEATQYREELTDMLCSALGMEELAGGILSLKPAREGSSVPLTERQAMLRNIEKYLRDNYRRHVNNQTLALAFGYVPSYISMLFRQAYGVSPGEYLTQVRLEQAKRLMQHHPDMLIREVAERVGFKSQHHFSRTFKKKEGVWPASYAPDGKETDD